MAGRTGGELSWNIVKSWRLLRYPARRFRRRRSQVIVTTSGLFTLDGETTRVRTVTSLLCRGAKAVKITDCSRNVPRRSHGDRRGLRALVSRLSAACRRA